MKEVKLTSGTMPNGMNYSLQSNYDLKLGGTPTNAGTYKVVFWCVLSKGDITEHTVTISVTDQSVAYSSEEITCTAGQNVEAVLHPELQGQQLKTAKLTGGAMPNGMNYQVRADQSLALSGTPVNAGTSTIVFECTLDGGAITNHTVTLTVKDPVLVNPFEDVYETDDYYNAVLWAYYANPQITNGMDSNHFGPQLTVTRGQAVTFLWRSQGCPEPKTMQNPFEDVPSTEYFYKPILWAVEQGITKGVDETHFNPMDTLSTQHMITFLYRTKNPGMDGWDGGAAAWAADENGRPFGVDIAVNNTTPCPRCKVVQFLYELGH